MVLLFHCKTQLWSPLRAAHFFLSTQPSRSTIPHHHLCPAHLSKSKEVRFYILVIWRVLPHSPGLCSLPFKWLFWSVFFFFFPPSLWAVTPTLYGERQRAFIALRKPFTWRQLERLSVRLALFTLGWVLCKAWAWSPFPHRSKRLMRARWKKERKYLSVLPVRSLFTFCLRGNSSGWVPAGVEKQPPSSERKKEAMFVQLICTCAFSFIQEGNWVFGNSTSYSPSSHWDHCSQRDR